MVTFVQARSVLKQEGQHVLHFLAEIPHQKSFAGCIDRDSSILGSGYAEDADVLNPL